MLDYFHTNHPMCSCSNNHTVWSTPIQREKIKDLEKSRPPFRHQPLPRLLMLLNALLLAQLLGQRRD